MKRLLAIFVAVALIASLCATVVSATDGLGDSSADIYIKVDDDGSTVHKYSVDIEFGNMHFVYGASAIWDSEIHDYYVSEDAVWAPESDGGDQIRIVNHSDLPIQYSTGFENVSEKYGAITVAATPTTGVIEKCPVQAASAPTELLTVALAGTPEIFTGDFVPFAKVIVTIEPVA